MKKEKQRTELTEKHKKRILKHAKFISKLPEEKLEMKYVACLNESKEMNPKKCNSAACAMGWLPVSFPEFFKYHKESEMHDEQRLFIALKKDKHPKNHDFKSDGPLTDFDAAEYFFGMTGKDSNRLFGSGNSRYSTPKQVSKSLKKYAKTGLVPKYV